MKSQARLVTAALLLTLPGMASCNDAQQDGDPAFNSTSRLLPSAAPAKEICLNGVHRNPRENILVKRAFAAPLSSVKRWVLAGSPETEWDTFSSTLARAPLGEIVGVCVLSKVDGSAFTPTPGVNTPPPTQAIVAITRLNGESTLFSMGSTADMLAFTPTSLPRAR